jgi:TonB family protein
MVRDAVARVKPRISACGDKSGARGTVKVAVTVDASGDVSEISVEESPDAALGTCVSSAMRAAHFGRSKAGGSFKYPFVF